MKKLLILFLCLVTVFSFAGCGGQTEDKTTDEATNVIDLGGGLGSIEFEGDAFGNYKVIETPDEFVFSGESEITVYEDTDCDTPYIVVYRFAKGEDTLETIVQEEADLYSEGYYQMYEKFDDLPGGAYFSSYGEYDGNYYYIDSRYIEDGDDIVVIDCYGKTEELQIGDTDVYAWIPVGYTDKLDQDNKDHDAFFWAEYSDDYYFPEMWMGKWNPSYEYLNWYWAKDFPDGVPYTEEEYAEAIEKLESGNFNVEEYYKKIQHPIVYASNTNKLSKYDYNGEFYSLKGLCEGTDIWFKVGDDWYNTWFKSELDPKPAYASAFLKSLHTK